MRGEAAFVDRGRRTRISATAITYTTPSTTHDGPAVINAKARYWSKISIYPQSGAPVGILP